MRSAARFPATMLSIEKAKIDVDGSVNRLDNFAHRRLSATRKSLEPSKLSSPRRNHLRARQALENLRQKARGCSSGRGEGGEQSALILWQRDKINHHPDCVIRRARQLHGRSEVCHGGCYLPSCRVRRIELATTEVLDSNMAAAAKIGVSTPLRARLMPAML